MTRIQAAEYTERRMTMEENRIPDVSEKSPWERAMGRVLMGIILTSLTLNFWCLDHILPAIGTVLMVLGFRALRKENPWFRSGYLLAAVRAWCVWVTLILNTTILPGAFQPGRRCMGPGQPGPSAGRIFLSLARIQGCPAAGGTSSQGRRRGRTDGVVWGYVHGCSDLTRGF